MQNKSMPIIIMGNSHIIKIHRMYLFLYLHKVASVSFLLLPSTSNQNNKSKSPNEVLQCEVDGCPEGKTHFTSGGKC